MRSHDTTHWIIRANDGVNFLNSNYPFWGVKRGHGGGIKTIVNKIKPCDILWFLTSKPHGGKFIGMCEYTHYYDKEDEPLISVNTFSNKDQNWKGEEYWSIQIHYKNLYIITETQQRNLNLKAVIQCGGTILEYETFKKKGKELPDLSYHYENFKNYAEPKIF